MRSAQDEAPEVLTPLWQTGFRSGEQTLYKERAGASSRGASTGPCTLSRTDDEGGGGRGKGAKEARQGRGTHDVAPRH